MPLFFLTMGEFQSYVSLFYLSIIESCSILLFGGPKILYWYYNGCINAHYAVPCYLLHKSFTSLLQKTKLLSLIPGLNCAADCWEMHIRSNCSIRHSNRGLSRGKMSKSSMFVLLINNSQHFGSMIIAHFIHNKKAGIHGHSHISNISLQRALGLSNPCV